jgi:hypothetical protein
MDRSLAAARAGFLLAVLLFAGAWPRPAPKFEDCARPVLTAPAEIRCLPPDAVVPRLAGPARRLYGLPIDPNRADPTTLETLPGIGPARARAIVAEREKRPFTDVRDLSRVRGLGPARLAALAPFLGVETPLAVPNETSVTSPGCRTCCGTPPRADPIARLPMCEEDR